MKQLTSYCRAELSDSVSRVLHRYNIPEFMHMPEIYGTEFKQQHRFEKDRSWQANVFVLFPDENQFPGIINTLKDFGEKCAVVKPCLQMVVSPVELYR
ncbi:MAG: hypothetical protein ACE5HS_21960 [bacterium]